MEEKDMVLDDSPVSKCSLVDDPHFIFLDTNAVLDQVNFWCPQAILMYTHLNRCLLKIKIIFVVLPGTICVTFISSFLNVTEIRCEHAVGI